MKNPFSVGLFCLTRTNSTWSTVSSKPLRQSLNIFYLCLICLFFGCKKDDPQLQFSADQNLAEFIENNPSMPLVRDSLIACAFGGQIGFLEDAALPVSILFYPVGTAHNFLYFETNTINVDPENLSNYNYQDLTGSPVFNGYLHRFHRPATIENLWGRIVYLRDGEIHISNAIRLKFDDKPTEFTTDLIAIDQTDDRSPIFTWADGRIPENAIYFQAIADESGNLVSGTYTFEQQFQFYNLSNVVLNIRDISPAPTLAPNSNYRFIMMGVSLDNWVNLIIEAPFETGN